MVMQRPDKGHIVFMPFHALAKIHHVGQIQPVAVHHMKMQHHWAIQTRDLPIEVVQVAKQIAVKQAKKRQIGDRCQPRGLLHHLRIAIVANAFFTAFAVTVDKR